MRTKDPGSVKNPSKVDSEKAKNRIFERSPRTCVWCAAFQTWCCDSPLTEIAGARFSFQKFVQKALHVSHNVDFSHLPTRHKVLDRPFLFTLDSVIVRQNFTPICRAVWALHWVHMSEIGIFRAIRTVRMHGVGPLDVPPQRSNRYLKERQSWLLDLEKKRPHPVYPWFVYPIWRDRSKINFTTLWEIIGHCRSEYDSKTDEVQSEVSGRSRGPRHWIALPEEKVLRDREWERWMRNWVWGRN